MIESYEEKLETLSMGSVNKSFDPYRDIDWDNPVMNPAHEPELWVLTPEADPLAKTEWYQSLDQQSQIEIGKWRQANVAKVGSQFENILVRGMQQYAFGLPNGDPEYRYTTHEAKEECNHQLMFQEMVNRIGLPTPGMPKWARLISPIVPLAATITPTVFFFGVLGGEEPIDHIQKNVLRSEENKIHPMMSAIMQLHVAEEARHISFAHEYVKKSVLESNTVERFVLSLALPVTMRILHDLIVIPPKEFAKTFSIPEDVFNEAYLGPVAQEARKSVFGDVRMLAKESGLINPMSKKVWELVGVNGRASRYRSEPQYEV